MEPVRIGIIGTENSHSVAAMDRFNVKRSIAGATVVALCPGEGDTLQHAREIAEQGQVTQVVAEPEALLDLVDAVIIMNRHGGLHAGYARLSLRANLPTFVDKPLTCDIAEAVWQGTSFQSFFHSAEKEIGPISAGLCAGPCQLDSEHGGVFFYGIHTVEMMLQGFGYDVASLHAHREGAHATVTVTMESGKLVTLQLLGALDTSDSYDCGFRAMLHGFVSGERLLSDAQLLQPVHILTAIQASLGGAGIVSLA